MCPMRITFLMLNWIHSCLRWILLCQCRFISFSIVHFFIKYIYAHNIKYLFQFVFQRLPKDDLPLTVVSAKPLALTNGPGDKIDFLVKTPRKTIAQLVEITQVCWYWILYLSTYLILYFYLMFDQTFCIYIFLFFLVKRFVYISLFYVRI